MMQSKFQLFSIASIGLSAYFANKNISKHDTKSFKRKSILSIALSGIIIFLLPT